LAFAGGIFNLSVNEGGRKERVCREIFPRVQLPASGKSKLHALLAGQPPRMLAGVCTPQTGRGSPRAPQQPKSPRGPCADTLKAPLPWESFQVTGGGEATPRSQTRLRGRGHGRRGECWHDGADEPGRTSLSPGGAAPSQGQRGGNTGWGTAAPLPPHPPVAVEILSCKICPGQDDS